MTKMVKCLAIAATYVFAMGCSDSTFPSSQSLSPKAPIHSVQRRSGESESTANSISGIADAKTLQEKPQETSTSQVSAGPRLEVPIPKGGSFKFFQRFSKNNYWDSGKEISVEAGTQLLSLLAGSEPWHPREETQYAAAIGGCVLPPGIVATLEVSAGNSKTRYTFHYCCDLVDVEKGYLIYVVPRQNRKNLITLLKSMTDPDRGPLAP